MLNLTKPFTTGSLIEMAFKVLRDNPDAASFMLKANGDILAFNGVIVVYKENGRYHVATFTGDDKPIKGENDPETTSEGQYFAYREAASFIVARGRDNSIRLCIYPRTLEFFGPLD
jgi:hypothetical protein